STLHTLDATETINRIIGAFPPHQQKQVRLQLAAVLRAVVSQRLVARADGKGRVAAVEVLRMTSRVRELIEDKDRTKELHDAIQEGHLSYGMQSFDQSLTQLVGQKVVAYEEAKRQATNPDDFALRFSGISATSDSKWDSFENPSGQAPVPGSASFGQNQAPPPAAAPNRFSGVRPPGAPAQPAAKPAPKPPGDDDFQIERF